MRFTEVLRAQISTSFANMCLLPNDLDTPTTARGSWFHNVHALEPLHLTFILPSFVVFRKDVSCRCNVIVLAMCPLHSEDIPPKVILPSKVPSSWEVIDLLVLVDSL